MLNTNKLPVIVLSGFLGAGKTTVHSHILNNIESALEHLVQNSKAPDNKHNNTEKGHYE